MHCERPNTKCIRSISITGVNEVILVLHLLLMILGSVAKWRNIFKQAIGIFDQLRYFLSGQWGGGGEICCK
jgi:hypothetical protein